MNQKNIITIILSTLGGAAAALIICLVFFFFFYKPVRTAEKPFEDEEPTPTPVKKEPESPRISTTKAKLSEINSVSINTSYTGFYNANSECRKSSDPSPKPDDTISLSYSPCRTNLTFNRNGEATKSLVIKRPNKNVKEPEIEEKSEWKSKITAEQFESLLKGMANNSDFMEWANVSITHGNVALWAYYNNNGVMHLPLYIDIKKGNSPHPAVNAFKELDEKVAWKKV